MVQNGKHFKLKNSAGTKVIKNEFTLGEECEIETISGEKVKVGGSPSALLCFWNIPWSLIPGLPDSEDPGPYNTHPRCRISKPASWVRETENL